VWVHRDALHGPSASCGYRRLKSMPPEVRAVGVVLRHDPRFDVRGRKCPASEVDITMTGTGDDDGIVRSDCGRSGVREFEARGGIVERTDSEGGVDVLRPCPWVTIARAVRRIL